MAKYTAYAPSMTEAQVRAMFVAKWGYGPSKVWRHNVWLAGPIRGGKGDSK